MTEGDTKSGKPRVVDIDPPTVAGFRSHRKARGAMALQLARDDALVFADHEGRHLQPEHFSRSFADALRRCAKQLAAAAPPAIRLHDLRHTHATILLTAGVPVHVVSQRLGHASPVITLPGLRARCCLAASGTRPTCSPGSSPGRHHEGRKHQIGIRAVFWPVGQLADLRGCCVRGGT